jgi:hypothetical protein
VAANQPNGDNKKAGLRARLFLCVKFNENFTNMAIFRRGVAPLR